MENSLPLRLFTLAAERPISLLDIVPDLTKSSPNSWNGPCPFCREGKNRFVVWPRQEPAFGGRYHCNLCGKTGNGVHLLRELHGWPYVRALSLFSTMSQKGQLAPEPPPKPMFVSWKEKEEYIRRTDEYRELLADIDEAEIGYRATVRVPDLYTDKEKDFWEKRLSDLYALRDSLDQDFTLDPP